MKTGYFARAHEDGHSAKFTQVHIVNITDGKPICRYEPHKTMIFQWCSGGVNLSYVECKECRKKYKKLLNKLTEQI